MERRIAQVIARQNRLREELREAKRLLGVADEHFLTASSSNLQGATLLEALTQVPLFISDILVCISSLKHLCLHLQHN